MRQVIHQAPIYEHVLESYEAETYVKGRTHVPRKNPVPLSDEELNESISSSHHRKPNKRNW